MDSSNFDYVEVHVSTTSPDFIPTPETLRDTISSAGGKNIAIPTDLVGEQYYVKLVGVTKSQNKSDPSVVASAAPGQLETTDIPDAIIEDTMVNDVSVNKMTDGELTAAVLMGGTGQIATNTGAARVEYTQNGLRAYNTLGEETVGIYPSGDAAFSGSIFGGTIDIPGAAVFNQKPGRLHVDDTGIFIILNGTTNLVTNPSFEKATGGIPDGVTGVNATATQSRGPRVQGFKGNPDYKVKMGSWTLKVVNTTAAGYARLNMANLLPSTTYTLSFYTAVGEAVEGASTNPFQAVYANFSLFEVTENGGANRVLKDSLDGGQLTEGTFQGFPIGGFDPTLSTAQLAGLTTFNYRFYATFTTPADLVAGGAVSIRLPGGLLSDGTVDTTKALFYDAVQLEATPYFTKYCDGDQQDCTWSGTAHASTSNRVSTVPFSFRYTEGLLLQGKIIADDIEVRRSLKLGSGTAHASNYVSVYRAITDNIASGATTWSDLLFDSVASGARLSTDDGAAITDSFMNFIANKEGLYVFNGTITFPGIVGAYNAGLRLVDSNSGAVLASSLTTIPANINTPMAFNWSGYCSAGQKVKLQVMQASGATRTLAADADATPRRAFWYQLL